MHEQFDVRLRELSQDSQVGHEMLADVLFRVALKAPEETSQVEIASGPEIEGSSIEFVQIPQGTVSKAVKALKNKKLLEDGETLLRREGRVVAPLRLGRNWGIAGAKVMLRSGHPESVMVGLTGMDGQWLQRLQQPLALGELTDDPWGEVARVLHDEITKLREEHDRDRAKDDLEPLRLFGIGVEVAAHVHDGQVVKAPGVGWHDTAPLATRLEALFEEPLPVVVENDVNALAVLAMHQMHYAESDLVVVAVFDEGVGGGLVMDGRLRRGGKGMAMEIGHLTVGHAPGEGHDAEDGGPIDADASLRDFDPRCPCGVVGHLDAFATPRRIREALGVSTTEEASAMPARTSSGEPTRQYAVFHQAGAVLGRGLAHVINIVNPTRLILYLPAELASVAPDSAAAAYGTAAKRERENAYSTGAEDAVLNLEPLQAGTIPELGARAAAVCVLNSFIEHARGQDGCRAAQRPTSKGAKSTEATSALRTHAGPHTGSAR
jgi:predicted NBD/HSP70 family sugar kinase